MSKRSVASPVGGSSLLVIFAVLCMTVFSLLALATVKADGRMADESTKAVEEYYKADCEAEKVLGQIREGKCPEEVIVEGNLYAYATPISDTQVLSVIVEVEGEKYKINQWKAVRTKDWSPEKYIKVWMPE